MSPDLIAPCGMDCSICSAYLAFSTGTPRKRGKIFHCIGCRARNKQCAYLKGQCARLAKNRVEFCFECPDYPCARLLKIDARYRNNYGMSFIQNLEEIRSKGLEAFMQAQQQRYGCGRCGGKISIHNKKCFSCDKIHRWKS